jgi:hypothetical protein
MGMSTHVVGFRPPDEKFKAMKRIWDACDAASIEAPEEVREFFGHCDPDEAGVEVDLEKRGCVRPFNDDSQEGFEVDIAKLPKDVTIIRFWNSW